MAGDGLEPELDGAAAAGLKDIWATSSGSWARGRARASTATRTGRSSTTGQCSGGCSSSAARACCCGSRSSSRSFLPGWMFNIATLVHGEEALLAVGFIFTIHFFNGHMRPEKFPMDPVIFTGRITEHEMLEERGAEYDRLVARRPAGGRARRRRRPDERRWFGLDRRRDRTRRSGSSHRADHLQLCSRYTSGRASGAAARRDRLGRLRTRHFWGEVQAGGEPRGVKHGRNVRRARGAGNGDQAGAAHGDGGHGDDARASRRSRSRSSAPADRRLGVHEQQRVLRDDVPLGAPGGAADHAVSPRARQLRRMPHGPHVDAAPDGAQARRTARSCGA